MSVKNIIMISATALIVFGCGYGSGYAMKSAEESPSARIAESSQSDRSTEGRDFPFSSDFDGDESFSFDEFGSQFQQEPGGRIEFDFDDTEDFRYGGDERSEIQSRNGISFSSIYSSLDEDTKNQLQNILGMSDAELQDAALTDLMEKIRGLDSDQKKELISLLQTAGADLFSEMMPFSGKGRRSMDDTPGFSQMPGSEGGESSDFSINF